MHGGQVGLADLDVDVLGNPDFRLLMDRHLPCLSSEHKRERRRPLEHDLDPARHAIFESSCPNVP